MLGIEVGSKWFIKMCFFFRMDLMFAKARDEGRLHMGPQDGFLYWVQCFQRLGVEAGSKWARKMGLFTGFNIFKG